MIFYVLFDMCYIVLNMNIQICINFRHMTLPLEESASISKRMKLSDNLCRAVVPKLWGLRTTCDTRRPSRGYANRPTFCFSSQKYIFTAIVFTCRFLLINS